MQRDAQIATADRLTHRQLLDNLPNLYREFCAFLRTRDAFTLSHEVQRDAGKHGELRWQSGYRIDEVIRELEILRHIVSSAMLRWDGGESLSLTARISAVALTNQFFAEVSVASVKQFMGEQQALADGYTQQLKEANATLSRSNLHLEQTYADQRRITNILTDELQNHLRAPHGANRADTNSLTAHSLQALRELLEHSEWLQRQAAAPATFSPSALCADLVRDHQPQALERGLRWHADCSTAPGEVIGDRETIRRIAAHLLSSAIVHTPRGAVELRFTVHASDRWKIVVQDNGPGLSERSTEPLGSGLAPHEDDRPIRAIGLSITQSLVVQLGGSLQVVTQPGKGTRVEVVLPRRTAERRAGE